MVKWKTCRFLHIYFAFFHFISLIFMSILVLEIRTTLSEKDWQNIIDWDTILDNIFRRHSGNERIYNFQLLKNYGSQKFKNYNSCVVFWQFFAKRVFLDDNSERRHASKKLFPRTPPEISSRNFWCNKIFQKKNFTGGSTGCIPEI